MNGIKTAVLISSSPRNPKEAVSEYFASLEEERLKQTDGLQIIRYNVRETAKTSQTLAAFQTMLEADALIFTFPLYFFCLPGLLMRFLQDYYQYYLQNKEKAQKPKVYAVINCGFPEPELNEEAVRVIQSFSHKVGAEFRFGMMVGGGGMIPGTKDAPFMRKTLAEINSVFDLMREDILGAAAAPTQNIAVAMRFPRRLYLLMGNMGWPSMSKKNGLKKKDLYAKPYQDK